MDGTTGFLATSAPHPAANPARALVVDLDGTLTEERPGVAYADLPCSPGIDAAVAAASGMGFRILVATARGMRSRNANLARIQREIGPEVNDWLDRHCIEREATFVGKVWCGRGGYYVDDRNLHIEDAETRFTGPFAGRVAHVVLGGTPDAATETRARRIERLLELGTVAWAACAAELVERLSALPDTALVVLADAGSGRVDLYAELAPLLSRVKASVGILVATPPCLPGLEAGAPVALATQSSTLRAAAQVSGNASVAAVVAEIARMRGDQ